MLFGTKNYLKSNRNHILKYQDWIAIVRQNTSN